MTPPGTILRVNHGRRQLKCWEGRGPTNNLGAVQEWARSSFRPVEPPTREAMLNQMVEQIVGYPVEDVTSVVIDGNVMPPLA